METNPPTIPTPAPIIPPVEPVVPPISTSESPKGSKMAMVIGVVVLLIVALGGVVYFYISNQGPTVAENPVTSVQAAPLDSLNKELETSDTTGALDQDFTTVDSDLQSL